MRKWISIVVHRCSYTLATEAALLSIIVHYARSVISRSGAALRRTLFQKDRNLGEIFFDKSSGQNSPSKGPTVAKPLPSFFWGGFATRKWSPLLTPEDPSGAPKEEFGRMIFQKKSSLGDRTKVPRQMLVEVRRGTGIRWCEAPCILSSASL